MRAITYIAASSAALLSTVAEAGILFSDIRPRSYRKERKLDIHVGYLYSPYTIITHDMYYLNYCESNKGDYSYHDLNVEEDETEDFEKGVTMWDTNLHESFFLVSVKAQSQPMLLSLEYINYSD